MHHRGVLPDRARVTRVLTRSTTVLLLLAAFVERAWHNLRYIDFRNSNFFFFWLAGRMTWLSQNPYDSVQWLAGHDAYAVTWRPNQIFPYPLPLAYILAPIGLLPLPQAYFAWQVLSGLLITLAAWILLQRGGSPRERLLLLPLVLMLMFFGPVFLSLQIGGLGPLMLIAVIASIGAWDTNHPFLAGLLIALTLLKPPQGVPILVLCGYWILIRGQWRSVLGIIIGGLVLLVIGMLGDLRWVEHFGAASQVVLDRTLGLQSNALGFAYLACRPNLTCMWILGAAGSTLCLGIGAALLWRGRRTLSAWEALSLILPLAFVATVYLWSYDQVLYIIPIVWISVNLIRRTRSYLPTFGFMIVLVMISFGSLLVQARTRSDLLSVLTSLLIFGTCVALMRGRLGSGPIEPPATL
jgi:glycosyl transferase family 87